MIEDKIFAQAKPSAGVPVDLYTVEAGTSAVGKLWIAAQIGVDRVSVQIIPASILGIPVGPVADNQTYLLKDCPLVGNVPIYIQDLHLNQGDVIRIGSERGDCSFTFTGEQFS